MTSGGGYTIKNKSENARMTLYSPNDDPYADPMAFPPIVPFGPAATEPAAIERAQADPSDLELFIGPNAEKFLSAAGFEPQNNSIAERTCWSGFFAPIPWFYYRKMYGLAALAAMAPFGALVFFQSGKLTALANTAASILGLLGRRLYVEHARRLINAIRSYATDETEARGLIARAGGVSVAGAWIGAVIAFALFFALLITAAFSPKI